MANDGDTSSPQPRGPPPGATAPPDHVTKPQVYEIFNPSRAEDGDGKFSPAGSPGQPGQPGQQGQQARPTMTEGFKSIKQDDWLKVHHMPCARQGFLTGIGSGFVVGFIRYLTGGKSHKSPFEEEVAGCSPLTTNCGSASAKSCELGRRKFCAG
jgi:cytochrome c oxidase assembly protein subunit 20